jgi:hypothetical protein
MKIFQNNTFPIKIRKQNTDSQSINIFNYRNVFFKGDINISDLNIDSTSSASFLEQKPINIENINIESGKLLLIDQDVRIISDVIIANGGEIRII